MTTLHLNIQDVPGLGKKRVQGIDCHTDNGVPCLKLIVPGMRAILVHYDNTPAVKKLESVGIALDGRTFRLDGEKVNTILNVDWLIKYSYTPEGLVNIASVEKNPMPKQNPKPLPKAPEGALTNAKPSEDNDKLYASLETAWLNRCEQIRKSLGMNDKGADSQIKWQKAICAEYGQEYPGQMVRQIAFSLEKAAASYESIVKAAKVYEVPPITQVELDADTVAAAQSSDKIDLNKEFPRDANNRPLDASVSPGIEPTTPKHNPWQTFYTQATGWGYTSEEVKAKVFGGVAHMDDTGLSPNEAIKLLRDWHFASDTEKQNNIWRSEITTENAPISNEKGSNFNEDKSSGVHFGKSHQEQASISRSQNEGKNHHMEAPVIAYTTIIINDHRVNVTAREGATAEQVHDTVIALINGLRLIAADETIKSYAAVVDSRDKAHTMKGNIKTVDAPHIPSAVATAPTTTGNGHDTSGGTANCALIKVSAAYTNGKTQLEFECDGMEHTLKYTRPAGDMVKLLSKVKQANGKPFAADDLIVGNKYGGAWRIVWNQKPESKYRDVLEVLPA